MKLQHVDITNIGQHDKDNSFLLSKIPQEQFNNWMNKNWNCVPIGFCEEASKEILEKNYVAFVFEEDGNRYYVHVPEEWMELEIK